ASILRPEFDAPHRSSCGTFRYACYSRLARETHRMVRSSGVSGVSEQRDHGHIAPRRLDLLLATMSGITRRRLVRPDLTYARGHRLDSIQSLPYRALDVQH